MTEEVEVYQNKKRIMASYGTREMFGQFITAAFGFNVLFFYEAVIGLQAWLIMIAFAIYSLWNAFNDPLIGYIMEKIKYRMPWERKWGYRRVPWMLIGAVPWLFTYLLIYMVPVEWYSTESALAANQFSIFFWYLLTIILYDTLLTLYDVNVISMYPIKFPGSNERRVVQGFGTVLGILGLVLAVLLPGFFITDTGSNVVIANSYFTAALFGIIIGFFFLLLILPGIWEDKRIRATYAQRKEVPESAEIESFFRESKKAIKDKRLMLKILFFFGYQVGGVMLQNSGRYIVTYILGGGELEFIIVLGSMLLGAAISIPLWVYLSKKIDNNKKLSVYAGFAMFITVVPMIFLPDGLMLPGVATVIWAISLFTFGIGVGGQWFMDPPMMGDVLDDHAARTGKRQQSIYYGFQAMFIRLGYAIIIIVIALVHILTGFDEGIPTLAQLMTTPNWQIAQFGIRLHSSIIPAIIVFITTLIFWKYFDLTPDKVKENKKRLKELGL